MNLFLTFILLSVAVLGVGSIIQASRFRSTLNLLLLSWNLGLVFVILATREGSTGTESGLGMGTVCLLLGSVAALLFFSLAYRKAVLTGPSGQSSQPEKETLKG